MSLRWLKSAGLGPLTCGLHVSVAHTSATVSRWLKLSGSGSVQILRFLFASRAPAPARRRLDLPGGLRLRLEARRRWANARRPTTIATQPLPPQRSMPRFRGCKALTLSDGNFGSGRRVLLWPVTRCLSSRRSPSTTSPRTAGSSSPARCGFSASASPPPCDAIGFWMAGDLTLVVSYPCVVWLCEVVECSCWWMVIAFVSFRLRRF